MKMTTSTILILLFLFVLTPTSAFGHQISTAYLQLQPVTETQLQGTLRVQPYDLELAVGLDTNQDGELTVSEFEQNAGAAQQYLANHFTLSSGQQACLIMFGTPTDSEIAGVPLLDFPFTSQCAITSSFKIAYTAIMEVEANHKLLAHLTMPTQQYNAVLSASTPSMTWDLQSDPFWLTVSTYIKEGIIHIWIGIDHILFLIATLLTVNLFRESKAWHGQNKKRTVFKSTLLLVTAFTVAHSITLTLTALGFINLSSRWVELGIALSVLFTALNNIWPVVHRLGWITFAFGLLHGMGFASVFAELTSSTTNMIVAVGAFNLGVEIGQLAIVAIVLPFLIWARKWQTYAVTIMPACSSVIAIIAINWAIQRW